MKRLSITFILLMSSFLIFAQKDFEGTINYTISYEGLSEEMKPMESILPKTSTVKVKEGISKTETPNGMGGSTTVIVNTKTGETITLSNTMGNKIAIKSNANEEEAPEIEKTDDTKKIMGHLCKKVIMESELGETEIYYAEDLAHIKTSVSMNGVDGFPMEIRISNDYFTMIQTVSEIKEEKIKKIKMEVPSDYNLKTKEELKEMMGG